MNFAVPAAALQRVGEIANEIRMTFHGGFRGKVILVEGSDDKKAFEKFFPRRDLARFIDAHGWESVLQVMNKLVNDPFLGNVIPVLDSDYHHISGTDFRECRPIFTDKRDLEIELLTDEGLALLINEFSSPAKIAAFLGIGASDDPTRTAAFKERLFAEAGIIGAVRAMSAVERRKHCFGEVGWSKIVHKKTGRIDRGSLAAHLRGKCIANKDLTVDEIDRYVLRCGEMQRHRELGPASYCRGKDVLELAGHLFRSTCGSSKCSDVTSENMQRILRSSFGENNFKMTKFGCLLAAMVDGGQ